MTNQIHTVVFCMRGYKLLGGVQTVVDNLAQGFKERGYKVRYITLFDPNMDPIVPGKIWVKDRFIQYTSKNPLAKDYPGPLGIKLFAKRLAVLPWGIISWIRARLFLRTLNNGYAFIVAQPSGFSRFAQLLHRTKSVDPLVICQFHSSLKGMLYDGFGKEVVRAASSSQAFVALCEGDAQAFADYLGMPVGVAHNPSLVNYRPDVAREKKLVYVGRISPEKNIELAITAFSKISDEFPDWVFEIYGPSNPQYLDELRECADRARHPERIKFLGKTDHVDEVFSGASLSILTSWFEGFPMSMLEAARCGTPTVAVDCSAGVREIAQACGYLASAEDFDGLVASLRTAMSDDSLRLRKSEAAKEYGKRHDINRVMDTWEALFEHRGLGENVVAYPH